MNETTWWGDGYVVAAPVRALATGEGLKETFLSGGGLPARWQRHLDRLARGAATMGLPCPDPTVLAESVQAAAHAHLSDRGELSSNERLRVRLLLLAAGSTGNLAAVARSAVLLSVTTLSLDDVARGPVRLALGPGIRSADHPLAGCKTTAIAADLVALRTARSAGFDDVLLRDVQGRFAEASTSSLVFGLADGRVLTPSVDCGPVSGTVVGQLLDSGTLGAETVATGELTAAELTEVRWAVLLNAIVGARPVSVIDRHPLKPPPSAWCEAIQRWVWTMEAGPALDPGSTQSDGERRLSGAGGAS